MASEVHFYACWVHRMALGPQAVLHGVHYFIEYGPSSFKC